jgi:tetratricopeptide (TPR) repeat protein
MFTRLRAGKDGDDLEKRLSALEKSSKAAANGYETQHLMQAANLCAEAGEAERALRYLGEVLDRYLDTGRFEAAEALSRRMLRIAPGAVRVRGTRVWLAAARGSLSELQQAVVEYVRAGSTPEQEKLVARQLVLLAAACTGDAREIAAEALLDLGATHAADHWLGKVYQERNGLAASREPLAGHEWGERMLEAALMTPDKVLQRSGSGGPPDRK